MKQKLSLPLFAAGAGNIIWGFSYLFIRIGQQSASPEVLLAIRFVVAFFLMNLLVLFGFQKVSFRGKPWGSVLILALAEGGVSFLKVTASIIPMRLSRGR